MKFTKQAINPIERGETLHSDMKDGATFEVKGITQDQHYIGRYTDDDFTDEWYILTEDQVGMWRRANSATITITMTEDEARLLKDAVGTISTTDWTKNLGAEERRKRSRDQQYTLYVGLMDSL